MNPKDGESPMTTEHAPPPVELARAGEGVSPLIPRPGNPRWRQGRRLAGRLLVVAALGMALVVFHRPILTGYARLFEVNDPAPSDAIVLLLGGLAHRPDHAAALYRQGLAPRIVFATLDENMGDDGETPRTLRKLLRLGVPREAITVLPHRAESTKQEAQGVREEARRLGWKRITVVTSDFHTRRARWIFRRTLADTGVTVHMASAHNPRIDSTNWWRGDEGLVLYVDETLKTLYYWLRH